MKPILSVLGGSSVFTAALIDALVVAHRDLQTFPSMDLVLTGRNQENLALVRGYAIHRLADFGWNVRSTLDMRRALDGATVVIHQIRYGGFERRAAGERVCRALGLPEDETLGAASLLNGLYSVAELRRTIAVLKSCCPAAQVLNLTNPLSAFTAIMNRELSFCVGLCELPIWTLKEAAAILEVPASALEWEYVGLNHRGFIVSIKHQDRNLLSELPHRLMALRDHFGRPSSVGGIDADEILRMQALPLKYFQLVTNPTLESRGRADFLDRLSMRIKRELRADPTHSPGSLAGRYMEWYPHAVVPMLRALNSDVPSIQVVNVLGDDGIAWELKAPVSRLGIGVSKSVQPVPQVAFWLDRFRAHEHALLNCLDDPTRLNLRQALLADPTVPESRVGDVVTAIEAQVQKLEQQHV